MTRQADEVQQSMRNVAGGNQVEKSAVVRTYDREAVRARMTLLRAEVAQNKAAEADRRAALAAVPVEATDVALIADVLFVSEEEARRMLQAKNGDVTALLREAVGIQKAKA